MGFEAGAALLGDVFAGDAVATIGADALGGSLLADAGMSAVGGDLLATGSLGELAMAGGAFDAGGFTGAFGGDLGMVSGGGAATGGMGLGGYAQIGSSALGLYQGQQMKGMAGAADPFGKYRGGFAQQLQALMANPSSVTKTPGYQAGMDAAQQSLTRNLASQGLTGSGTAAEALTKFGAEYQGQQYQQQIQNLMGLSGANIAGAGTAAQITAGGMNTQNQSPQNLAKVLPALMGGGG
jgi:hypothetical protein